MEDFVAVVVDDLDGDLGWVGAREGRDLVNAANIGGSNRVDPTPLTKSQVNTEGFDVEVTQRLKRVPTIIDKLRREPTMQLANMQDVAGCRAVLGSLVEVGRVQRRLSRNRPPRRMTDYIAEPRPSGYRGVHLTVAYDDRNVEVQLRTRVMHEWAITVERLSGRLAVDLKSSVGPREVLALLRSISEAMATEEQGGIVTDALLNEIDEHRRAALPFLTGGTP